MASCDWSGINGKGASPKTLWFLNFSVQNSSLSKFLPLQTLATEGWLMYERLMTLYPCSNAVSNSLFGPLTGMPFVQGRNKNNLLAP